KNESDSHESPASPKLPSRRMARMPRERSGASTASVLVFLLLICGLGGAAVGARTHSELPAEQRAQRLRARAEYLARPSTADFAGAIERIRRALEQTSSEKQSHELHETIWLLNLRAVEHFRSA